MDRRGFFALLLSLVSWASTRLRAHENAQIGQDKSEQTGENGLFEVVCLDSAGRVVWRGQSILEPTEVLAYVPSLPWSEGLRYFALRDREGWIDPIDARHGEGTYFPDVWVYHEADAEIEDGYLFVVGDRGQRNP